MCVVMQRRLLMSVKDKMQFNLPMQLKEVATVLGWSENHIRSLIAKNSFPYCQPSGNKNRYFLWNDVQQWLESQKYVKKTSWQEAK